MSGGDIVRIPHRQPAQTATFILDKDDKNAKQIKKLLDRRAQTPKYSIENKKNARIRRKDREKTN